MPFFFTRPTRIPAVVVIMAAVVIVEFQILRIIRFASAETSQYEAAEKPSGYVAICDCVVGCPVLISFCPVLFSTINLVQF